MRRQNTVLLAVVFLAAVLTINAQAMPVACTATYSDGLTCGTCSPPTWTTTNATLQILLCGCRSGGSCYRPAIDTPYAFSMVCAITLPEVGETFNGGLFDQTFHDTTRTHEDWHFEYGRALAGATYGRLETWSAAYWGGCFHTVAEALATGNTDMTNALTAARDAFNTEWPNDVPFERAAGSGWQIVDVDGEDTYRSVNPDWGAGAVAYASGINVSFTTSLGECPCVPEPMSLMLGFMGLGSVVGLRRFVKQ